jgi:hypothetical protein
MEKTQNVEDSQGKSWRWPVHMFFGRSVTVLGSIENSCESPMKLVFRSSKITGGVDIGFAKNEP